MAKVSLILTEDQHFGLKDVANKRRTTIQAVLSDYVVELLNQPAIAEQKTGTGQAISFRTSETKVEREAREFGEWMSEQYMKRDTLKISAEKSLLEAYIAAWTASKIPKG